MQNQLVERVITRRLSTTGNKTTYITNMNEDLISVLVAKEFVLNARKLEQDNESFNDSILGKLDHTIYNIAKNCGSKEKRIFQLPSQLQNLPRKLFLLRRGPLLGPILQHPDDIDWIRSLFLNASFEDSKRIIEPPLYMVFLRDSDTDISKDDTNDKDNRSIDIYQVPVEDLSLQSDKVLILDHHTDIFIWSGLKRSSNDYNYLREYCLNYIHSQITHRFPQPNIMLFKEGTSMARWLQCRLIPSHKDSLEEQLVSFSQLDELTQEELAKLMSKFHRTDDLSFNQYYRSLFI